MSGKSKIAWTEATWNPTIGCSKVSPGCLHCYAEIMAGRLARLGTSEYHTVIEEHIGGNYRWNGKVALLSNALGLPGQWRKPRMIFVDSMSDLFHSNVPVEYVHQVFDVMMKANWHTYQVLTKRADRMAFILGNADWWSGVQAEARKHIWLGVSVEDQKTANERIPELLKVSAAVRFVSVEPMLEKIGLELIPDALYDGGMPFYYQGLAKEYSVRGIQWVICGGESQFGCRPFELDWARDLRDQCKTAGVNYFSKQIGGFPYKRDQLRDFPEDLQIRQFPQVGTTWRLPEADIEAKQIEFPILKIGV